MPPTMVEVKRTLGNYSGRDKEGDRTRVLPQLARVSGPHSREENSRLGDLSSRMSTSRGSFSEKKKKKAAGVHFVNISRLFVYFQRRSNKINDVKGPLCPSAKLAVNMRLPPL